MHLSLLALCVASCFALALSSVNPVVGYNQPYDPYVLYPSYYQQPYPQGVNWERIFFGQILNNRRRTTTTITTTTSTFLVTCTVSAADACARKRNIRQALDVAPTPVTTVIEPTAKAILGSERKERQIPVTTDRAFQLYPSTFDSSYQYPGLASNYFYHYIPVQVGDSADERFFFAGTTTVTITSTSFTLSTSTSRPTCSSASNFAQCS